MKKISFYNILNLASEYQQQMRIWRNQDFVRSKMFHPHLISEAEHLTFLEKLAANPHRQVFVGFLADQPFGVLNCDYFPENNDLEFGFYLIDQDQVNSGLGLVMEYVLLNYAFDRLRVSRVFCRTFTRNKKVVSLHSKFGFQTEQIDQMNEEKFALQSITPEVWQEQRSKIENLLKYIAPIDEMEQLS